MHSSLFVLAVAALGLALHPAQEGKTEDKPEDKPAERPLRPGEKMTKDFQGLWRLVRLESESLRGEGRSEAGYLLATPTHLSLEVHIGWQDDASRSEANSFSTGMHSYTISDDAVIAMSSLIGTSIEQGTGRPIFEPPGRGREYEIEILDDQLVLNRRSDRQKFVFSREGAEEGLDFYGRKKKPKAKPPEGG